MASPFRTPASVEQDPPETRLRRVGRWFMTPKIGRMPWCCSPMSGSFYGTGLAQVLLSGCTEHGLTRLVFGLVFIIFGFAVSYFFLKRNHVPERDGVQARRV